MQHDLGFEDGANDKLYFTMVPNYVLNHSTANDQALYLQMKRFAGEKAGGGLCYATKKKLRDRLGIGKVALAKSIDYLCEHGWITHVGVRKVATRGGSQDVDVYRVNDIWKLNVDFYQGGAETDPLAKGGLKSVKGGLKTDKGGAETSAKKNNNLKQEEKAAAQSAVLPQDTGLAKINERVLSQRARKGVRASFGDPAINAIIAALKDGLGVATLDGSEKVNRHYAAHLIRRLGGGDEGAKKAVILVGMALNDPFHSRKATGVGYLYKNALRIFKDSQGSQTIKV